MSVLLHLNGMFSVMGAENPSVQQATRAQLTALLVIAGLVSRRWHPSQGFEHDVGGCPRVSLGC